MFIVFSPGSRYTYVLFRAKFLRCSTFDIVCQETPPPQHFSKKLNISCVVCSNTYFIQVVSKMQKGSRFNIR